MQVRWMSDLLATKELKPTDYDIYGRTPFLRDYGAIVHSSKLRRLSHKTQVYLNPSVDYPRTRLTHSLEVSQIGRQIARAFCNALSPSQIDQKFRMDFEDLVATACLAHDLGQPPFGHRGEKVLAKKLIEHGIQPFELESREFF